MAYKEPPTAHIHLSQGMLSAQIPLTLLQSIPISYLQTVSAQSCKFLLVSQCWCVHV